MKNPISPLRSPIMAALTAVALAAGPALASPPDKDRKVAIKGGYNSDFSSQSGFTAIDGSLAVGAGELTVADLEII